MRSAWIHEGPAFVCGYEPRCAWCAATSRAVAVAVHATIERREASRSNRESKRPVDQSERDLDDISRLTCRSAWPAASRVRASPAPPRSTRSRDGSKTRSPTRPASSLIKRSSSSEPSNQSQTPDSGSDYEDCQNERRSAVRRHRGRWVPHKEKCPAVSRFSATHSLVAKGSFLDHDLPSECTRPCMRPSCSPRALRGRTARRKPGSRVPRDARAGGPAIRDEDLRVECGYAQADPACSPR